MNFISLSSIFSGMKILNLYDLFHLKLLLLCFDESVNRISFSVFYDLFSNSVR